MSLTDPGMLVTTATATDPAAGDLPPGTDPGQAGSVDSAGVDTLRDGHPRLFDPYDDPCNYLG